MNDLFSSSSFKRYTDLKQQTLIDDIEAAETTVDLSKFFEEVENVKQDIWELENLYHRLQDLNEEAKVAYNATTVKNLRSRMDKDVELVLRRVKAVKAKLEALDRSNVAHRSLPGCGPGSSSDRTRMSVLAGLGKKLKDLMDDFHSLRGKISAEYKETVGRRYCTITGQKPDERTIEKLISSGESEMLVQKAIQEQGRGQVMDTISEIQERHGAVQELEKNLMDLHQVFLDMAVLVDAQGQQLDNIESHIAHASSFVRSGAQQLEVAKTLQSSSRKWTCMAIVIVLVVVVIVVVPVVVSFTRKDEGN